MPSFPPRPPAEVVILGAGFSKSLSSEMPLTDELGNEILQAMSGVHGKLSAKRFQNGYFEAWLSRLAEDQPDLTTAQNLENRATFERCTEVLATVLNERMRRAQAGLFNRGWLSCLLGVLHARKTTVITFNQDTLVEMAIAGASLHCWDQRYWRTGSQPSIAWTDIIDGQPPPPSTRYGLGEPLPTFRLLKLHGSTNWYWRPGDASGTTTARWFLPGELTPDQALPDEAAARRRELPGRVPLVVPPAAAKSIYYQTPILTQLWQDARSSLMRPGLRVSLLGYSIPPTDLVTTGMLRETLVESRNEGDILVDVVNPDSGTVRGRLAALGIGSDHIETCPSVEEFVHAYHVRACREVSRLFWQSATHENDSLLLVGTSVNDGLKVTSMRENRDSLDLILEDVPAHQAGIRPSPDGDRSAATLRSLQEHLDRFPGELVAVGPSGRRHPVVGACPYVTDVGAGTGRWQVLITSKPVREG